MGGKADGEVLPGGCLGDRIAVGGSEREGGNRGALARHRGHGERLEPGPGWSGRGIALLAVLEELF